MEGKMLRASELGKIERVSDLISIFTFTLLFILYSTGTTTSTVTHPTPSHESPSQVILHKIESQQEMYQASQSNPLIHDSRASTRKQYLLFQAFTQVTPSISSSPSFSLVLTCT